MLCCELVETGATCLVAFFLKQFTSKDQDSDVLHSRTSTLVINGDFSLSKVKFKLYPVETKALKEKNVTEVTTRVTNVNFLL